MTSASSPIGGAKLDGRSPIAKDFRFSLLWVAFSTALVPALDPFVTLTTLAGKGEFSGFLDPSAYVVFAVYGFKNVDDFLIVFAPIILLWPLMARKIPFVERTKLHLIAALMIVAIPYTVYTLFNPGVYQAGHWYPAFLENKGSSTYLVHVLTVKVFFIWLLLFLPRLVLRPLPWKPKSDPNGRS